MDTFYIIANPAKAGAYETAFEIQKRLEEMGKVCYVQEEDGARDGIPSHVRKNDIPEGVQAVLVLGGDGTLLRAARTTGSLGIPLLGINMGTLGYLAEIELAALDDTLRRLASDDYTVQERMMLEGTVSRNGEALLTDRALGDIVIARSGHMQVVDISVFVDDAFLCSYTADGIIISTATGSTGYSLSAGGPIVSPDAFLMLLTAISPHTLNSRPVVLPDNVSITVQLGGRDGKDSLAEAAFDGEALATLHSGDIVTIKRSSMVTRLIRMKNTSFVELLRQKMN